MGSSFTPQLKRLLLSHNCRFERQGKGDHEIWFSPNTQRRFVVDWRDQVEAHCECRLEAGWDRSALLSGKTGDRQTTDL
jgi:hypothetical protein